MAEWQRNQADLVAVHVGETRQVYKTVRDKDGALIDLTSAQIYFTARAMLDAATTILKRTTNAGGASGEIDLLNQVTYKGQFRINLLPADTVALSHGSTYVYDVWVVLATGERLVVVDAAPLRIDPRVSVIP